MEEKIDKAIETAKRIIPSLITQDDMQKAAQAVLNLAQARAMYAGFGVATDSMDKEIAFVLGRVRPNLGATEMMKVAQAVLNLMHAKSNLEPAIKPAKTTKTRTD